MLYFNLDPQRTPQKLSAVSAYYDNSITVTWFADMCPPGQPYISQYFVQYCPVETDSQLCKGN